MKYTKAAQTTETNAYQDINPGGTILEGGTSKLVCTGDWRVNIPTFHPALCKQCLLCVPVCPDSSIPVQDGTRLDFDFMHCKGCGICDQVCPFGAITMAKEEK